MVIPRTFYDKKTNTRYYSYDEYARQQIINQQYEFLKMQQAITLGSQPRTITRESQPSTNLLLLLENEE